MPLKTFQPKIILQFPNPGLPQHYTGPLIKGAEHSYITDNFGESISQSVSTDKANFTQQLIASHLPNEITKHFEFTDGMFTRIMIDPDAEEIIKGVGKNKCGNNQFYSLVGSSFDSILKWTKAGNYTNIGLWWSAELLKEIWYEDSLLYHPDRKIIQGYPEKIIAPPVTINKEIEGVLDEIRNFDYTTPGVKRFFHEKMKKLARLILKELHDLTTAKEKFKAGTLQKILLAKQMIDKDPFNEISEEELAEKVELSTSTLRDGISRLTGFAYHEYRKHLMLTIVGRKIILENINIKDILEKTGYKQLSSLSKAFKTMFWCTTKELGEKKWGSQTKNNYEMSPDDKYGYGTIIARYIASKTNPEEIKVLDKWLLAHEDHLQLFENLIDDEKTGWAKQWFTTAGIDHSIIKWTKDNWWYSKSRNERERILFFTAAIIISLYYLFEYLNFKYV